MFPRIPSFDFSTLKFSSLNNAYTGHVVYGVVPQKMKLYPRGCHSRVNWVVK